MALLLLTADVASAANACRKNKQLRKGRGRVAFVSILAPDTLLPIPGLEKIKSNAVLDLADLPYRELIIKARVKKKHRCRVRSVRFGINSLNLFAESNQKPYLFGRNNERSFSWQPEPGTYTIDITPYKKKRGRGRKGVARTVALTIIDSSEEPPTPPTPRCTAGADKVISSNTSSVQLSGLCEYENIRNIKWRYISGAGTWDIANENTLRPTVSDLYVGIHHFELSLDSDNGSFKDTVWVAVSRHQNGYNYTASIQGPQHVVAGYSAFYELNLNQIAGGQERVHVAVSGLPEGSTAKLPDWIETCCSDDRGVRYGWDIQDTLLEIETSPSTAPGDYLLVIAVGSGGNIKTLAKRLTVETMPEPLEVRKVSSVPSIPLLSQWQENMTNFGNKWCTDSNQNTTWEGNVWYYDGTRVFYQIADYTGYDGWKDCLGNTLHIYRNQIFNAYPGIQGWRVFPHGLYRHYTETNDSNSRDAILRLVHDSTWASYGGSVNADYSRETAYLIHAYLYNAYLGEANHPRFARAIDFALGHLEQLTRSRTAVKVKPFMLGLTFEALIHYYEQTGDPRIPGAIKDAADWLWIDARLWSRSAEAFLYVNDYFEGEDPPEPAPDLNLLIAPVYAWLYHKTGDDYYRAIGDAIFKGGVAQDIDGDGYYERGSCLECTGKFFSQNYRWSFDFVRWRLSPPQ